MTDMNSEVAIAVKKHLDGALGLSKMVEQVAAVKAEKEREAAIKRELRKSNQTETEKLAHTKNEVAQAERQRDALIAEGHAEKNKMIADGAEQIRKDRAAFNKEKTDTLAALARFYNSAERHAAEVARIKA